METVSCLIKDIADVAYHEADGIISYVKEVAINELKSMPSQMVIFPFLMDRISRIKCSSMV